MRTCGRPGRSCANSAAGRARELVGWVRTTLRARVPRAAAASRLAACRLGRRRGGRRARRADRGNRPASRRLRGCGRRPAARGGPRVARRVPDVPASGRRRRRRRSLWNSGREARGRQGAPRRHRCRQIPRLVLAEERETEVVALASGRSAHLLPHPAELSTDSILTSRSTSDELGADLRAAATSAASASGSSTQATAGRRGLRTPPSRARSPPACRPGARGARG